MPTGIMRIETRVAKMAHLIRVDHHHHLMFVHLIVMEPWVMDVVCMPT